MMEVRPTSTSHPRKILWHRRDFAENAFVQLCYSLLLENVNMLVSLAKYVFEVCGFNLQINESYTFVKIIIWL